MKNFAIVALLCLSVVLGVGLFHSQTPPIRGAGQDESFQKNFYGGLITKFMVGGIDGAETITSSTATTTLTAAQVCSGRNILFAPAINNASVTLPTAAALVASCLPRAGYFIDFQFRNTAATTTFIVVAGSGMTLFHLQEVATTTAPSLAVVSSTPTWFRVRITLASSTDSTASLLQSKFVTP